MSSLTSRLIGRSARTSRLRSMTVLINHRFGGFMRSDDIVDLARIVGRRLAAFFVGGAHDGLEIASPFPARTALSRAPAHGACFGIVGSFFDWNNDFFPAFSRMSTRRGPCCRSPPLTTQRM